MNEYKNKQYMKSIHLEQQSSTVVTDSWQKEFGHGSVLGTPIKS